MYTIRESLNNVGLTTVKTRRLRGDLTKVFNIFNGFDDVKSTNFFTRPYVKNCTQFMNLSCISLKLI